MRDRFLEHLAHEKRCSVHTVDAYRRDLGQFEEFVASLDLTPEQADDRTVRAWLMQLLEHGDSSRTAARKLSALRAFYRFARTVGAVRMDPTALVEAPKAGKRLPRFVEGGRMEELFTGVTWPDGPRGRLDRLVLELLYGTGMRLAELIGLRCGDVDPAAGTLRVLGKRNKERILPLTPHLQQLLKDQLIARQGMTDGGTPAAPLLLTERGQPLARRSVQRTVERYLGLVTKQEGRSPHVLRHTFATHMLENGADLNAVKELLGHAGLAATQVYTHNTVDKLRRVHQQAHPRGGS